MVVRRLALTDNGLEIVSNFRQRLIAGSDIESVTFERGGGVFVRMVDASWTRVPDVGTSMLGGEQRSGLAQADRIVTGGRSPHPGVRLYSWAATAGSPPVIQK